ncbi:unnamed protein product [Prorocentrum cordatum]|uniref:Uncharacterized protein n=1 Tax=Prorocentrum cordatum TaxID=2364126 RepID=A0ABN9YBP1_9DINO|nr:unnamed protein product [Polarella glacialis]
MRQSAIQAGGAARAEAKAALRSGLTPGSGRPDLHDEDKLIAALPPRSTRRFSLRTAPATLLRDFQGQQGCANLSERLGTEWRGVETDGRLLLLDEHCRSPTRFFAMDDLSVHLVWGFLPLPCVGRAVPAACRLMLWLREEWQAWQAFAQPLRRPGRTIRIARLLRAGERGVEHLAGLAAVLEEAALRGFSGAPAPGGSGRLALQYGELAVPRVQWSLHSEGLSPWRGVCSLPLDAEWAVLPPWRKAVGGGLRASLLLGVSLWLPPEGVSVADSFPGLMLSVTLQEPELLEALAERSPSEPPCLAAACDALLVRGGGRAGAAGPPALEEWRLRFCFGPQGHRHAGHGDLEGYRAEVRQMGRKRWRPPDLCYTPSWEQPCPGDAGLRLLLRGRRCDGLLE